MIKNTYLEMGNKKIRNALDQAIQAGTHKISVTLPEKEYKAVMRDFLC